MLQIISWTALFVDEFDPKFKPQENIILGTLILKVLQ